MVYWPLLLVGSCLIPAAAASFLAGCVYIPARILLPNFPVVPHLPSQWGTNQATSLLSFLVLPIAFAV